MPTAASVPITGATTAATTATIRVIFSESKISELLKREEYHLVVNPCHTTRLLESLKEKMINTTMGAYRKRNIRAL